MARRRPKDGNTYVLVYPNRVPGFDDRRSHIVTAPLTSIGVREWAQKKLGTKTMPDIHRAIDALRATGVHVYREIMDGIEYENVRLPKHLEKQRVTAEEMRP